MMCTCTGGSKIGQPCSCCPQSKVLRSKRWAPGYTTNDRNHLKTDDEVSDEKDCGCREKRTNWMDSAVGKIDDNGSFVAAAPRLPNRNAIWQWPPGEFPERQDNMYSQHAGYWSSIEDLPILIPTLFVCGLSAWLYLRLTPTNKPIIGYF